MKQWFKKILKFNVVLVCLGLILGGTYLTPTVNAKTTYKTLAFDKKLETAQDFEKGEFKNSKIKETAQGIEMDSLDDRTGEYITPIIQAPFDATYIGLHWKQELSDDASIIAYLRTSNDGINFSEWVETTADADEGRDDMKSDEVFAALVGVEKTSFAQVKIEFIPNKGISPKLNNFTFTFINSGEESKQVISELSELSLAPKSIAVNNGVLKTSPNGQSINVISREDWGADESYRLTRRGAEAWPRSYHGTRKLVVHHTAGISSNGVTDLETNKATVRAIYYYHAITQGWGDIGYNALVDAAGNIYEGRYGTHDAVMRTNPTPDQIMVLDVEAAQASSYNSGSFGVSAMGDFTSFDIPDAQLAGVENVLAYVVDSRGIDALGSSDFRRNDGAWHMDLNNIIGHRDVNATACPGDRFYSLLGNIKTTVANLMQPSLTNFSATVDSVPISGSSVGLGMLNFSWDGFPSAAQYQYTLERVFGMAGVASDSESWQTAWLNAEDINTKTIANTSVQIDAGTLKANSNYVFYVRALDANGIPISLVSHANFFKDGSVNSDIEKPVATITAPSDGSDVTRIVSISASASDNIGVTSMKLYIDGKQAATSSTGSLNYSWNTKRVTVGLHTINVKAYDAAGNMGESTIIVDRVK